MIRGVLALKEALGFDSGFDCSSTLASSSVWRLAEIVLSLGLRATSQLSSKRCPSRKVYEAVRRLRGFIYRLKATRCFAVGCWACGNSGVNRKVSDRHFLSVRSWAFPVLFSFASDPCSRMMADTSWRWWSGPSSQFSHLSPQIPL